MAKKTTWEQVKVYEEADTGKKYFDGKGICDLLGIQIYNTDGMEKRIVDIGDGLCFVADTSISIPAYSVGQVLYLCTQIAKQSPVANLIRNIIPSDLMYDIEDYSDRWWSNSHQKLKVELERR